MAGAHAIGREPERPHRDDVRAVQRDQPMRGTHELDVAVIAAGGRVAHHLRNRQPGDRLVERFLQRARERHPLDAAAQVHVIGLAVGGDIEAIGARTAVVRRLRELRPAQRCELLAQRFRRRAVRVARHLGRHQLVHGLRVRRDAAHVRQRDREAPRRRVRRDDGRVGQQVARSQPARERVGERRAERLQRLRRQLLGDELDDERLRGEVIERGIGGGIRAGVRAPGGGGRRADHADADAGLRQRSGSIGKPSASREST